jgi:hypothetical protein
MAMTLAEAIQTPPIAAASTMSLNLTEGITGRASIVASSQITITYSVGVAARAPAVNMPVVLSTIGYTASSPSTAQMNLNLQMQVIVINPYRDITVKVTTITGGRWVVTTIPDRYRVTIGAS